MGTELELEFTWTLELEFNWTLEFNIGIQLEFNWIQVQIHFLPLTKLCELGQLSQLICASISILSDRSSDSSHFKEW